MGSLWTFSVRTPQEGAEAQAEVKWRRRQQALLDRTFGAWEMSSWGRFVTDEDGMDSDSLGFPRGFVACDENGDPVWPRPANIA